MKKDFLYKIAEKIWEKFIEKDEKRRWYSKQAEENLKKLYPFAGKEKTREYYIQKVRISLLLCVIGCMLAAGLFLSGRLQPVVKENKIYRQGYGGAPQSVPVEVAVGEEKRYELELNVRERMYGEEQLKKMYESAAGELETAILGKNVSLEHVETDLNLVTELPGYPFLMEWESMDYGLIDSEGKLRRTDISEEGEQTGLNAVFTYGDFRAEYLFYIQVYPETLTEEERLKKMLLEAAQTAETESREEEVFLLPSEAAGEKLVWKGRSDNAWAGVLFGMVCAAVLIYFLKDEDLKKEIKKREEQMQRTYPEMVSKLSVYLGAGVTLRAAWEKICEDYEKRKPESGNNPVYEEMNIVCQEMRSGISEMAAYERFGRRCGIRLYSKFSALLTQNLRKGSTKLGMLLKEESRIAFEERKNAAKKAGEEAGTKLLFPMMMMLCVVMVMILLPAFMSV